MKQRKEMTVDSAQPKRHQEGQKQRRDLGSRSLDTAPESNTELRGLGPENLASNQSTE